MRITKDHVYEHGSDAVYALYTNAAQIKDRQEALGARGINVLDCDKDSEGTVVRYVRELPAEVPGILAKFLSPWNKVEQSEMWFDKGDGIYHATLDINVANVPVIVKGTLELNPTDAGCVNRVRLGVGCSIPFVGKTLAEFVAADCERLLADEYQHISDRLVR